MKLKILIRATCLLLASAGFVQAENIKLKVDSYYSNSSNAVSKVSNIIDMATSGAFAGGTTGYMFCMSPGGTGPSAGTTGTFPCSTNPSSLFSNSLGAARGEDLLNWVIQTYLPAPTPATPMPDLSSSSLVGVVNTLREIIIDFGGFQADLSFDMGNFRKGTTSLSTSDANTALPILQALVANYDDIPIGFRATSYHLFYLDAKALQNSGKQNEILITPEPNPVPEPATWGMLLGGLGVLLLGRRMRRP